MRNSTINRMMYPNYEILTITVRRMRSQETAAHLAFKPRPQRTVAVATDSGDVRSLWRPNLRDEGDNFVLEIAVAAWPRHVIVTHNISDFAHAELRFRQVVNVHTRTADAALTH